MDKVTKKTIAATNNNPTEMSATARRSTANLNSSKNSGSNSNGSNSSKGSQLKHNLPKVKNSVPQKTKEPTTINTVISVNNKLQAITNHLVTKRKFQDSPSDPTKEIRQKTFAAGSDSDEDSLSSMEFEAEELEKHVADREAITSQKSIENQEDFTPVLSKKDIKAAKKQNRLAAIRIRISDSAKPQFTNQKQVVNEIKRCFPDSFNNFHIKFIEYAKYDNNILLIATDDKATHDKLNDKHNWRDDAFSRGVQIKTKLSNNPPTGRSHGGSVTYYNFSVRISTDIDVEDAEAISELKDHGFDKAVRTIKKSTNEPTSFVRLSTNNKLIYDEHVFKRAPIMLFYRRFYAIKENKPHQCWNCQGLGHMAFDCPNETPTCLQCGEGHRVKHCPYSQPENKTSNKTFCTNCKSNEHNSASRQCPKLKEHVKELTEQKQSEQKQAITQTKTISTSYLSKTTSKPQTAHSKTKPSYAAKVGSSMEIDNLKRQLKDLLSLLKAIFTTTLNKQTIDIPDSLKHLFNE